MIDVDIARLGQRAEIDFVGAPVGIMDQMASSLGGEGEALFLDTRSLSLRPRPAAVDDGSRRDRFGRRPRARRRRLCDPPASIRSSRTDARRREAARHRIDCLAEVSRLPEPFERRARHVITENARVLSARDALASASLPPLANFLIASHVSIRDDYEVSAPLVDVLVELTAADPPRVRCTHDGWRFWRGDRRCSRTRHR